MDCQVWLDLFGCNTSDEKLRSALEKKGIQANELEVEKDDISVIEDLAGEGITLVFTDEAFLYKRDDMAIGEGAPVLSELSLWLQESEDGALYTGPLPLDLQPTDSRAALRRRFGNPSSSDDNPPWDQWPVDGLILTAEYTEDEQSLATVSLELSIER